MLGNIVTGCSVLAPAGMLAELSSGLGVTIHTAGLLITFGAIVLCVGSPVTAWLTSRFERRALLTATLLVLTLTNAASAFAPDYDSLLIIRLVMLAVGVLYTPQAAGTAALDKRVAEVAASANLTGLEFLFGIPGTIGGALRMNAGANGGETKDILVEATAIDRQGVTHHFTNADMNFTYRASGADPSLIFTAARFRGKPSDAEAIRGRMAEVQAHRETAQPIREKTGGSTFKNPPGHSAWRLVDAAGCRGLKVGGAQVSEMHCNFLINTGNATADDIETLGETVRERVEATSGIALQWEIKRIGLKAR